MPEFEEPKTESNSKQEYTPSVDATEKPRTRRRSGGFKTGYEVPNSSIGEVDPAEALKNEKLSGGSKPQPKAEKKDSKPKAKKSAPKQEKSSGNRGNPQPSPETLAAIERVNARLAERKKERDAKRANREKKGPRKDSKKPSGKAKSSPKKQQSGGLISSILNFFGLGPKPPAKKQGGNRSKDGNRGKSQGNRPGGKGGKGGKGQNRRGGQGRRSGGGGKGPRRNNNRGNSSDNKS